MKNRQQIEAKIEELRDSITQMEMQKQSLSGERDFDEQLDYFEMEQNSLQEQVDLLKWVLNEEE
ncbi:hypothetical protein [Bacillus cereus]|uniref:hypothetical protein n=1 Tax=Bacillus cereus TaxID=1396 RepID=UPI00032F7FE6|nr:hypothetical protein [Bacillus cereus]EOO44172.1 hypothetical protein ICK_06429 [Bacillus cereus BAG1X2-2]EOP00429.1 hypothetical protein ICO_06385 [Bacillus cereus BAG2O-1]